MGKIVKKEKPKKISEIRGAGKAMFTESGKLMLPTQRKTAEELLKDLPANPRLEREIAMIERKYDERVKKETSKKVNKSINTETMMKDICNCAEISTYISAGQHVVQYKKKTICWIANRKYGIGVSVWGKGGEGFKTMRIVNENEMKDMIKKIKGGII